MNALDQIEAPGRAQPLEIPRELSERLGRALGVVAVGAVAVLGVMLAVDSAQHSSSVVANSYRLFPGWEKGLLSLLPGSTLTGSTYSELTFGLCIAYVVAVLCARWLSLKLVASVIVGLHVVYLLTPPLASTDIWNYIGYSHMGALHGLSPYSHTPLAIRHDPAFPWVTWPDLKTPYGPLFTIMTYAIAPLGMAGGVWVLKLVLTAAALGTLWLVYKLALRLGVPPVPGLVLVGLSPAWLIWLVGGAHNDGIMMTLALGGVALWLSGRDRLAALAIVLAAGVKAPAILILPFIFIASSNRRAIVRGALEGVGTIVALTLIAFHSFQPLTAFSEQNGFASNRSVIGEIFRLFNAPNATPHAGGPALALFAIGYLFLIRWVVRGANPIRAAGWATAGLLAVTLWEFPWYLAWSLPLAALARDKRLKVALVAMTIVLIVAYVPPYLFLT